MKHHKIFTIFPYTLLLSQLITSAADINNEANDDNHHLTHRLQKAKLTLWSHGAFALDENALLPQSLSLSEKTKWFENLVTEAPWRLGPVISTRRSSSRGDIRDDYWWMTTLRGGGDGDDRVEESGEEILERLGEVYGDEFREAIARNKKEHDADCELSCEAFYCADPNFDENDVDDSWNDTSFVSYSFGSVPPEDFANDFGFPLDLIKVSGQPLIPREEAQKVISGAEDEGVLQNQYTSGKYKLGGDWLINLPQTRTWFNNRLRSTFFPLLARLFPEIISHSSVLRAHSVSLLRYNSTHPRTDVHVDNGILAMTIAMSARGSYEGGGTFFEHMGVENVLEMDVGHGTFRPGSVRHGGHKVESGERYILGAFLLLTDRVEHVRRLKNKGAERRREGDFDGAEKYFEWALGINPKCTTCLKDWAEILLTKKQYNAAETKIRRVLELLENQDSDALFTLGIILSEQGRDDESIEAYTQSVALNADDAELCYNLGIKLGAKGQVEEELKMYRRATQVDPHFGGAWINWGTTLAERGDFDEAEAKFTKATECDAEVSAKATMNLILIHHAKAKNLAAKGEFSQAETEMTNASQKLNTLIKSSKDGKEFDPLKLQTHQLTGQIYAANGNYEACEEEYRKAVEHFPNDGRALFMLSRILELRGKTEEVLKLQERMKLLQAMQGSMFGP